MREIKFRAWDKEQEKWTDGHFWRSKVHASYMMTAEPSYMELFHDDFLIMQYTGLKDINSVEIYEGDIVRLDKRQHGNKEWSATAVIKYDETPLFDTSGREVEDYYNGWNIHSKGNEIIANRSVLPLNSIWIDHFGLEVIGNIYENPELIQ